MVTHWYFQKKVWDYGSRTWGLLDKGMFAATDPIAFETMWDHYSSGANNYDRMSFAWEWDTSLGKWRMIRRA